MSGENNPGRLSTVALLLQLGFVKNGETLAYDFGNCEVRAVECINMRVERIVLFSGVASDQRTIHEIDFEMPLYVASYEQGVAYLAYRMKGVPLQARPQWLQDGERWRTHLPWVKA